MTGGRTRTSLARVQRLDRQRKRAERDFRAAVLAAADDGWTMREISANAGVGPARVHEIIHAERADRV